MSIKKLTESLNAHVKAVPVTTTEAIADNLVKSMELFPLSEARELLDTLKRQMVAVSPAQMSEFVTQATRALKAYADSQTE